MLVLSTINALLSQLVSTSLHTALLITPQGHLISYCTDESATSEDRIRILIGLSSEVWKEGIEGVSGGAEEGYDEDEQEGSEGSGGEDDEEIGMLECELGRILVYPIFSSQSPKPTSPTQLPPKPRQPALLLALNSTDAEPWGLMHTKARALGNYLKEPLAAIGDRLSPGTSPTKTRAGGHQLWAR